MILASVPVIRLNTLRKDGFLPYLLPRAFAGETREGEQALIYQQPARAALRTEQRPSDEADSSYIEPVSESRPSLEVRGDSTATPS